MAWRLPFLLAGGVATMRDKPDLGMKCEKGRRQIQTLSWPSAEYGPVHFICTICVQILAI
jgi:hypothetical protein